MNKTKQHTNTDPRTAADINRRMQQVSCVLRKLLQYHKLKRNELSKALGMPDKTICQLFKKSDMYPIIITLLPIAKFFNITLGQLVGDEPLLDSQSTTTDDEAPVFDKKLFMQYRKLVMKILAEYKVPPIKQLAEIDSLIAEMYDFNYSPSYSNRIIVEKNYIGWYLSMLHPSFNPMWL